MLPHLHGANMAPSVQRQDPSLQSEPRDPMPPTDSPSRFSRATSFFRSLRAPGPAHAIVPRARSSVCHL